MIIIGAILPKYLGGISMYKLLIVDDEQSIRNGIVNSNPWHEWGYEIVGQASNGIEAVEYIKGNTVDVVLSDIRMPKMDGIELMKYLKNNYPDIKIIILSGYNDFEYLNMSIKNSVTEYLLKPTDILEFEDLFRNLKLKLDDLKAEKLAYHNLMEQVYESKEYCLDKQVDLLLKGYLEEEEELKIVSELEMEYNLNLVNCAVIICSIDDSINSSDKEKFIKKQILVDFINNSNMNFQVRFYINFEEIIVGIISKETHFKEEELINYGKQVQQLVNDELKISISIGISKLCQGASFIPVCYEQAKCSIKQRIFHGANHISIYTSLEEGNFEFFKISFNLEVLEKFLLEQNKKSIYRELDNVFIEFKNRYLKEYNYIDHMCLELLFNLSRWCQKYQVRLDNIMKEHNLSYQDIYDMELLEDKKNYLYQILLSLSDKLQSMKGHNNERTLLVNMIFEVLEEEYANNLISLNYVSDKVNKNPAYISRVFKEITGFNFSDYLIKKRLEKAKLLLEDYKLKIYEIAELTGYVDPSSFIKLFKKHYGMSPMEYRLNHGNVKAME